MPDLNVAREHFDVIILALAELSLRRPGWSYMLAGIVDPWGPDALTKYNSLRETSADIIQPLINYTAPPPTKTPDPTPSPKDPAEPLIVRNTLPCPNCQRTISFGNLDIASAFNFSCTCHALLIIGRAAYGYYVRRIAWL